MRRMGAVLAALVAFGGTAEAADILRTSFLARSWAGLHIGANLGYGWAHTNSSITFGGTSLPAAEQLNGLIGGLQIGYDWQIASIVFGFEADLQASGQRNDRSIFCPALACGVATTINVKDSIPWFGTLRGRLGVALDRFLIYGTGGAALGQFHSRATATAAGFAPVSRDLFNAAHTAWAIGAGAEVALMVGWSARIEYLHYDTGRITEFMTMPFAGTLAVNARVTDHIWRVGANYRF